MWISYNSKELSRLRISGDAEAIFQLLHNLQVSKSHRFQWLRRLVEFVLDLRMNQKQKTLINLSVERGCAMIHRLIVFFSFIPESERRTEVDV